LRIEMSKEFGDFTLEELIDATKSKKSKNP
jgi:hypothetical protein